MYKFREIIKDLIPPIIPRMGRFLVNSVITSEKKNSPELEDISTLRSCITFPLYSESVIIGNGPSVKQFMSRNSAFLENKNVFCLNSFVESEYFERTRPSFYVFTDPVYWEKNLSEKLDQLVTRIYEGLRSKVSWDLIILLPNTAREWSRFKDLSLQNKRIRLAYYNFQVCDSQVENRFEMYKANRAIIYSQTVLVASIFLSLNLGFKTNYVIGGDMTLHQGISVNQDNNIVCYSDVHFYDKEKPEVVPFWKNAEHTEVWKMDEIFRAFSLMFKGFRELEEYATYLNAKIYNISKDSFIDAFERFKLP